MNRGSYFHTDDGGLLGEGRRRRCHRLADPGLCVKFYRDPSSLPPGTRLSIRLNIACGRRFRCANVNYREWRYHQSLQRQLPAELAAVFPEHTEPVRCSEKGWGIIETLILNADGTLPQKVVDELKAARDPALSLRIYTETERLCRRLAEHSVCFFDPSNILVQWTGPETFRLRIADIEPWCRTLVPWLSRCDFYVRCKVRRRASRYLARLRGLLSANGASPERGERVPRPFFKRFAQRAGLV